MKKLLLSIILLGANPAFAQYYGYTSHRSEKWELFETLLMIVCVVVSIIVIVKFFQMANDIRALRNKYAPKEPEQPSTLVDNNSRRPPVIPYTSSNHSNNSSNTSDDQSIPFEYQGYVDSDKKENAPEPNNN